MKKGTSRFVGAFALALAVAVLGNAYAEEGYVKAAEEYCKNMDGSESCEFVDELSKQYNDTLTTQCWECGTVNGGWWDGDKLNYGPNAMISAFSMFKDYNRYISLACKNKVKIRAVFKLAEGDPGYGAGLDSGTNVTRCSLGTGDSPSDTENDCVSCLNDGCPLVPGTWYSDTMVMSLGDKCPPSDEPTTASIYVNPGQTLNVNSFTVEEEA